MDLYLPKEIQKYVDTISYQKNESGTSGDTLLLFEDKYVLKISNNVESLKKEYQKSIWLYQYHLCPEPITYLEENGKGYYLRMFLKGDTLTNEKYFLNPTLLMDCICQAVSLLRSLDGKECPFIVEQKGHQFVHGDFCFPNIIVDNDKVVGFIDVGNCGLGNPWMDYDWVLWNFEYQLKTNKYNKLLLKKLNIPNNTLMLQCYLTEEAKEKLKKTHR